MDSLSGDFKNIYTDLQNIYADLQSRSEQHADLKIYLGQQKFAGLRPPYFNIGLEGL